MLYQLVLISFIIIEKYEKIIILIILNEKILFFI